MTSNNSPENLFLKSSSSNGPSEPALTAGQMLRRAREERNIDLATLAGILKVSEGKLRALEADDFERLPEIAFTRGLAKSVCKRLDIDEKPILDLLPSLHSSKPSDYAVDLTKPAHPDQMKENFGKSKRTNIWWLLLVVLIIVLLFLFFMPDSWKKSVFPAEDNPPQNTATQVDDAENPATASLTLASSNTTMVTPTLVSSSSTVPEEQNDVAMIDLTANGENGLVDVAEGVIVQAGENTSPTEGPIIPAAPEELYFSVEGGNSTITVKDNEGRTIVTKTLRDGNELTVSLDKLPLKVSVGSVRRTTVKLRGQEFDLQPHSKNNVANFEVN